MQAPQLNFRQRIAVLLGGLTLLACLLYPETETSYYFWVGGTTGWRRFASSTERTFVLNAAHGEIVKTHPELDPFLRATLTRNEIFSELHFERRTAIKLLNLVVQVVAVGLATAGAVWALKS